MTRNDPLDLRRTLGAFLTGVTVITTREADGTPRGFTANSFASVSLQPPLILACVDHRAESCEVFRHCKGFAVNVLSENQRELSSLFASKASDKFERAPWRNGQKNAPLLDDCMAWFECSVYQAIDAGDHMILVGEVMHYGLSDSRPLGYCRGHYVDLGIGHTRSGRHGNRIGYILDYNGEILFEKAPDDGIANWILPLAPAHVDRADEALKAVTERLGVRTTASFLFSVFSEADDTQSVFYRCGLLEPANTNKNTAFFDANSLPWGDLPSEGWRVMLRRYLDERQTLGYGVYFGNVISGTVTALSMGHDN